MVISVQFFKVDSWNYLMFTGTSASIWNIYDSFCDQSETPESEKAAGYPESTVNTSKGQEKRGQQSNSSDTISNSYTGNTTWLCWYSLLWDWRGLRINKFSLFIKTQVVIFLIFNFLRQHHQLTVRNGNVRGECKCWVRPTTDHVVRVISTQLVSDWEEHPGRRLSTQAGCLQTAAHTWRYHCFLTLLVDLHSGPFLLLLTTTKNVISVLTVYFSKYCIQCSNVDCVRPWQPSEARGRGTERGELFNSNSGASLGFQLRAHQRMQHYQHGLEQGKPGRTHRLKNKPPKPAAVV